VSLTGTAASPAATRGIGVVCRGVVHIYRLEGYDVVALAGVDLDISPGESVALLGPSGSGKSTLLAVLAGLLRPAAGRVEVGGYDLVKATTAQLHRMRATDVGVALQGASRNLLPYLSAEQNVRFAQDGARKGRDLPSPRDVLALVGLDTRARTRLRPDELSPGERQRVALAVALANRPGLLLADEPTSQLDRSARDEVVAALEEVRRTGTTVVIVTHDPEVGARMRRTVTIRDGRVGSEGRLGEEYSVVGRDGAVHLPPEVLEKLAPGTLLRVHAQADGTVLLVPAGDRTRGPDPQVPPPAGPGPTGPQAPAAGPADRAVPTGGPTDRQAPVPGSTDRRVPTPGAVDQVPTVGSSGRPGPPPVPGPDPRPATTPAPQPQVTAGPPGTPPQVLPMPRDPAGPGGGVPQARPAAAPGAGVSAGGRVRRPEHLGEMLGTGALIPQPPTPGPAGQPGGPAGYAPPPDAGDTSSSPADPGAAGPRDHREEAR
jgi:putative ABC transport system ATP-binding protein